MTIASTASDRSAEEGFVQDGSARGRSTGPGGLGRTQAERRRESDRRMLQAAMQIIARKGVAGTTLAEIGVAAGYSRGLPVERFGTKIALLEALLDGMEAWFARIVPGAVGDLRGLAAVKARVAAHFEGAERSPEAVAVLYSIFLDSVLAFPELRPRTLALNKSFRQGFLQHLQEAQEAGEIGPSVDCGAAARIIVGMMTGLFQQWLADREATDLAWLEGELLGFISAALKTGPAGQKSRARRKGSRTT